MKIGFFDEGSAKWMEHKGLSLLQTTCLVFSLLPQFCKVFEIEVQLFKQTSSNQDKNNLINILINISYEIKILTLIVSLSQGPWLYRHALFLGLRFCSCKALFARWKLCFPLRIQKYMSNANYNMSQQLFTISCDVLDLQFSFQVRRDHCYWPQLQCLSSHFFHFYVCNFVFTWQR